MTAAINIPAGNSATPTVLKRKIDPMENDSRITKAHAYGVQYVESISFSTLTSISGGGGGSRREEQGFNTAHEFANPIVYRPSSHTDSKAFGNFSDKSEHGRPSHLQINQKSISGAGLVGALGIVIEPQQQQQHLQQQQNGTRHSASGSEAVHHPAPPQVRSFNQAMPIRTSSVPPPTSAPIAVRKYAPFDRNSNATFTQVTQQHQQHPPPPQLVRTLPYNPPQIQLHLLQNQPHDTRPGRPYPHYYHPTRSNSSHNSSVIATASFNAHNITRHGQSTTGTWKTLPSSTSSLSSSLSSTAIIGGSGGDRSINIYFARDGSIAKLGREVYQAWGLRPKELTAATRFSDIVMEGDDRIWIDRIFTEFFKPLPTSNILPKACDPVSGVSGASLDLEEAAVCGVTSSLLEEEEKKLNTAKEEKCNDDIIVHEEHKRVVRIFNKHSSRHEPYRVVAALTRITEIASTSPTKTYSENTYVLCSFTPTYC